MRERWMRPTLRFAEVLYTAMAVPLVSASPQRAGVAPSSRQAAPPNGPSPTIADVDYAPPEPATSKGHKLDLYIPAGARSPMPMVIWTAGSAWMSDMGKGRAEVIAAQLLPLGYVVAGVSIRSSSQVTFPGQLDDVKAADPPIMILHGDSDPLVPHNQGERLYMALNKACANAVFISLPKAGHGPMAGFLTDDALRDAATI